jgi:hypothetical protein
LLLCAEPVPSISILSIGFPLLGFVWSFETRLCAAAAQVQQEQQQQYQAQLSTWHTTWHNIALAKKYQKIRFPKMGVPPNHPTILVLKQMVLGIPHFWKPPPNQNMIMIHSDHVKLNTLGH